MDEDRARRIWKLEAAAARQERLAVECHAKGEPKYNLAENMRIRARAIRLANKEQRN